LDLEWNSNTGDLYIVIQHDFRVQSLSSIEIYTLDPTSGNLFPTSGPYQTPAFLYLSSSYDVNGDRFFIVMGNQSGSFLVIFNSGNIF